LVESATLVAVSLPLTVVAVTCPWSPLATDEIPSRWASTTVDATTAYVWLYPSVLVTVIEVALTDPTLPIWISTV
jgi:hypothetical protein